MPQGHLFFHLGAGVVEAGVISLGSLVSFKSSESAGNYLDQELQKAVAESYQIQLGLETIQKLKQTLHLLDKDPQKITVVGHTKGRPTREKEINNTTELMTAAGRLSIGYRQLLESLLTEIYPELTADILDKGMLLSGGFAQLIGLDQWLADRLKFPTAVVENPALAVIEGIKTTLENLEDFKHSFGYQESLS